MKISFFGGLNEIGGNKILLEHKKTRVFLDFGKGFSGYSKYFEEYIQPRRINGIGDFLALNLIPSLDGLYRPDYLRMLTTWGNTYGITPHKQPQFDAVLLSHAHADHVNYLSFIDGALPVYCVPETLKIIKTLDVLQLETLEGEIFDYKERRPDGSLSKKRTEIKKVTRDFRAIEPYRPFALKDFTITFLPVEHSIPGCSMIYIEGDFGTLLYSGDFRMGGPLEKENKTKTTLQWLADKKIDYMLCEGTRITESKIIHEEEVFKDIVMSVDKHGGLIAIEYSYKDLTRFQTFLTLAKKLKRTLVFPSDWFAYLTLLEKFDFPVPADWRRYVKFFARRKITFRGNWEREVYTNEQKLYAEDVAKNQKSIILGTGFFKITDFVDIAPQKNSLYIQSTSEPFNEEMEMNLARLKNWLKVFSIESLIKPHASGHISGAELVTVIKDLRPTTLIPIHTEYPELFKKFHKNVIIPSGSPAVITI